MASTTPSPPSPIVVRESRKNERMAGSTEEDQWRKTADTHKMKSEDVTAAGVEGSKKPPGQEPGGVLHQRRKLPFPPAKMAVGGFLIAAALGYFTLYVKKKPEASAGDVAKVATGVSKPEDTHPRK